jgi:hypothetical protein
MNLEMHSSSSSISQPESHSRPRASASAKRTPFRFFDLPYELRLRVYELIFVFPNKTLDLDPLNTRTVRPLLEAFLVSRRMHAEAYDVFYGHNTFRLFPTHGRFHHTKAPLLARLPTRYRAAITKVELRLGPSWTKPPRGWVVNGRLGLGDATRLRLLKVFVEFDPASHVVFEGFRISDSFYTEFSVGVVRSVFALVPSITTVEFDAWESVLVESPLLQGLVGEVKVCGKRVAWGPVARGWGGIGEVGLGGFMERLSLGAP